MLAAQLAIFERALLDIGYPVQLGVGVGAAMAELSGWSDETVNTGNLDSFAISLLIGGALDGARPTPAPIEYLRCRSAIVRYERVARRTPVPSRPPRRDSPRSANRSIPIKSRRFTTPSSASSIAVTAANRCGVLRVYTDRYLQQLLSIERPAIDRARYDSLAPPTPAKPGEGAALVGIDQRCAISMAGSAPRGRSPIPSIPTPKAVRSLPLW